MNLPHIFYEYADELKKKTDNIFPALSPLIKQCFLNTAETTLKKCSDGTYYVITGDIPALWLRDSYAQMLPYYPLAKEDENVRDMFRGLIKRHCFYVNIDPYSNAFNESANGNRWDIDETDFYSPFIWERKYETDSLCSVIYLIYDYYKATGDKSIFSEELLRTLNIIKKTFRTEQKHSDLSTYYFIREDCPERDTVPEKGKGNMAYYTGMTWSGFRPSDDRCIYNYNIPQNMMAAEAMKKASYIFDEFYKDKNNSRDALMLSEEIRNGVYKYGTAEHKKYGKIFLYETDGRDNYILYDDANCPSLLSAPFTGFCSKDDIIYKNTRSFILSEDNPSFFRGESFSGIGSEHTGEDMIWHISLIMQILTSSDREEKIRCLEMLSRSHNDTCYMHEAFNKNNPSVYTRKWFSWANSLFAYMITELKI